MIVTTYKAKHRRFIQVRILMCFVVGLTAVRARALTVLTATIAFAGCSGELRRIDESKSSGDLIITALEKYMYKEGEYPKTLDELTPYYIERVPNPVWGMKKWNYQAGKERFTLQVNESIRTGDGNSRWLRYMGRKYGWQLGD